MYYANHRLNNMKFALLNINSVRAKLDDLYELCKLDLYQIIFIQESQLDPSVPDDHLAFFDYKVVRRDRVSNGGGILILIKNYLKVINVNIDPNIESIYLKIQFANGQIINFISTYRPPVSLKNKHLMDEKKFLKLFLDQINKIDLNYNTFILGDLNFNLLTTSGDKLRNLAMSMNFKFLNTTKPTRLASNTLLDVLMTNNANIVNEHSIHACSFSDHCLVAIEINIQINNYNKSDFIFTRRINIENLQTIDTMVKQVSFEFLNQIYDINDKWILLKNNLLKIIDLVCPKVKIKIKQKKLPWLDALTFKLKNYRDKLY